ncbi:hypothetical protein FO519_004601 [Halicephalobus sp. NKZ332]|nr:hypothetical protein FO519_004601 [Halicephalobus sp. NKZ332]
MLIVAESEDRSSSSRKLSPNNLQNLLPIEIEEKQVPIEVYSLLDRARKLAFIQKLHKAQSALAIAALVALINQDWKEMSSFPMTCNPYHAHYIGAARTKKDSEDSKPPTTTIFVPQPIFQKPISKIAASIGNACENVKNMIGNSPLYLMNINWISKFRVNWSDFAEDSVSPRDITFNYSDFRYRKGYPQKIRRKQNQSFDINSLSPVVVDRLIELLPSLSRRILSFTCKKFYVSSIRHCGLEIEYLQQGDFQLKLHGVAQNGKLYINSADIPEKFYLFLNIHLLKYNPGSHLFLDSRIPRNYENFLIQHGTDNFKQGLDHLHPEIKTATFILSFTENLQVFRGFKDFLEALDNIERIYIRINFLGEDSIPVDELKETINTWFFRRKKPMKELYFCCKPSHDDNYDGRDYIYAGFKSDERENILGKRKSIELHQDPKNRRFET